MARAAFSPDGSRILSVSDHRTARIWQLDPIVVKRPGERENCGLRPIIVALIDVWITVVHDQALDETTTNRAIAYYIRAGAYKAKGDSDQAIADYSKAIEANSHYADAYAGRGILYQIKGDDDHAIADYAKAIEIDPRNANAYVGRGMVYRLKGDNDHAIADYTQAIEINPRYAIAYFNRGSTFQTEGKHDRAIADFTKTIELTPRDAKAYVRRGVVYQANGESDRAIADYVRQSRLIRGTPRRTFAAASCTGSAAIAMAPYWILAKPSRLMGNMPLPI